LARRRKKLAEGYEGAKELAERLNYNLTHNIDPDRRIHPEPIVEDASSNSKDLSPERLARINRKIAEGADAAGQSIVDRLNYNLTHEVNDDRRIRPEPPLPPQMAEPEVAMAEPEEPEPEPKR